ncbi:MAG: hypothetical protein HQL47_03905 [Gammaproteobacteria bacterium]|nr:hypothetical protein [Gammaproteobacteria bacterium]
MRKSEVLRAQHQFGQQQERALLEDINYLESRLKEMGYNGDCAYERAIERSFSQRLQERRQALKQLREHLQMASPWAWKTPLRTHMG